MTCPRHVWKEITFRTRRASASFSDRGCDIMLETGGRKAESGTVRIGISNLSFFTKMTISPAADRCQEPELVQNPDKPQNCRQDAFRNSGYRFYQGGQATSFSDRINRVKVDTRMAAWEKRHMDSGRAFGYHKHEAFLRSQNDYERLIHMNVKNSLRLALCFGLVILASGCRKTEPVPAAAAPEFPWQVDQFADLKVLRYQVPGFESLTPGPERTCLLPERGRPMRPGYPLRPELQAQPQDPQDPRRDR